jgi:hypothetical protein
MAAQGAKLPVRAQLAGTSGFFDHLPSGLGILHHEAGQSINAIGM